MGRYADAARSLEQVVALQPGRALAWHDLAWQREAIGDAAGAEAAIQQALLHGHNQAAVHQAVGIWCDRHGDRAAAEGHFLRAIDLDPLVGPARVHLAAMRWKQGDMAEAIRLYGEAAQARPDLEIASDGLAMALTNQRRYDEAITERRRWATATAFLVGWLRLAASLLRRHSAADCEEALAAIDRAQALAPAPRADVLFGRAEVLRVRGDGPDACRPLYEQARDLPDCVRVAPEDRRTAAAAGKMSERCHDRDP